MRNPYEIYAVRESDYGVLEGHEVLVTEWSDRTFTAFISRKDHGLEFILMDNDKEWQDQPSEDEIQEEILGILEDQAAG